LAFTFFFSAAVQMQATRMRLEQAAKKNRLAQKKEKEVALVRDG
jgi:hypothetical protein